MDEEIQESIQQEAALMQQFKSVHKALDQMRMSERIPAKIREEISRLEEEKEQVAESVRKAQRKLEDFVRPYPYFVSFHTQTHTHSFSLLLSWNCNKELSSLLNWILFTPSHMYRKIWNNLC